MNSTKVTIKKVARVPKQRNATKTTKSTESTMTRTSDREMNCSKSNLHYILKAGQQLIAERKKMWQSIFDFIEMIERDERMLEKLVKVNEEDKKVNELNESIELNDEQKLEIEIRMESDEETVMNRTFTVNDIEDALSTIDSTIDSNSLTPIPKSANIKKSRRSSIIMNNTLTLDTIDELSVLY